MQDVENEQEDEIMADVSERQSDTEMTDINKNKKRSKDLELPEPLVYWYDVNWNLEKNSTPSARKVWENNINISVELLYEIKITKSN